MAVLAKTGDNVVSEVLRGVETFYEWEHYPPDDVYDRETHAQFYYHAHPPGERSFAEHGHFEGMRAVAEAAAALLNRLRACRGPHPSP